jgi:unsaturated chondroitin disaccharide hydrolase
MTVTLESSWSDEELFEDCFGLIADGTLAYVRRLVPPDFEGYIGHMNSWTGRYARSERYVPSHVSHLLGRLWLLFAHTQNEEFSDLALRIVRPMLKHLADEPITHLSSGADIYLGLCLGAEVTDSDFLRERAVTASSNFVSSLWDESRGRFIPARGFTPEIVPVEWGGTLYHLAWCAADAPNLLEYQVRHQRKVLDVGLVRPDGSTNHIAEIGDDGTTRGFVTEQGWKSTSTWARGQSWALHNFGSVAVATGDQRFIDAATRLANWWMDNVPADYGPRYDFDDPDVNGPRDSCAAAMATAALIRMQRWSGQDSDGLRKVADATLRELCENYLSPGGVMLHSSWGRLGDRLYYIDVSKESPKRLSNDARVYWSRFPQEEVIGIGNYFIVEALYRRLHDTPAFPHFVVNTHQNS